MTFLDERLMDVSRWLAARNGPAAIPFIRLGFDRGNVRLAQVMQRYLGPNPPSPRTLRYRGPYKADVYLAPNAASATPLVVWIHGGGWIAGSRRHVGPYCALLAERGFDAAAIDYMLTPRARFPNPLRDLDAALTCLARDTQRPFVLAGDSAGAHIAMSFMLAAHVPHYARAAGFTPVTPARRLAGQMLYCGVFSTRLSDTPPDMRDIRRAFLGAYARKSPAADLLSQPGVRLPPTLIAAGDADTLYPQSVALADSLEQAGTPVTRLFMPAGAGLGHEYQFDLDRLEARDTLDHSIEFLRAL
jgi:acetyl esterase